MAQRVQLVQNKSQQHAKLIPLRTLAAAVLTHELNNSAATTGRAAMHLSDIYSITITNYECLSTQKYGITAIEIYC